MPPTRKPGRPAKPAGEAKTVGVTLRFSPEDMAALEAARDAEQPDCPLRIFLRSRLLRTVVAK